jgi:hypothetical protein
LLECAFCCAQISALKTQISINHANQCQFRKVIALCYQLRADDDVYRLVFNARYELGRFFRRPERVRCRNNSAGVRQQAVNLVTYALNSRTTSDQGVAFAAFGTFLRRWHDVAAMMAGEPTNKSVLNHPACAIRALKTVTAGSAQGQRRISPSVEEQQALLAPFDPLFQRFQQCRRNPVLRFRRIQSEVDGLDLGHFGRTKA